MAITINWDTRVITVPRADMTLVQTLPTEIRNLDLNWFRLQLKDLEDNVDGIVYLDTHTHNTEVSLGGLTYARVIEIINNYTVTFEDGQYAVNLTGANSNVGDVVNVNQVSVRSQNSAGLISSPDIEFASFNGGVLLDVDNGFPGTVFPAGTVRRPVNNLDDALLIADYRGFNKIYLTSDLDLTGTQDLSGFDIVGDSHVRTDINIGTDVDVTGVTITQANITGVLDGETEINSCLISDLTYFNGHIHNSGLAGTITLSGGANAVLTNCLTYDQTNPPVIDMGGAGQSLAMPDYSGIITVRNLTDDTQSVGIGVDAGMVIIEDTVTAGQVVVSGVGLLVDDSNGTAVVNSDGLLNKDLISRAVWDEQILTHTSPETTGYEMLVGAYAKHVHIDAANGESGTDYPYGTPGRPVNNVADALVIANKYSFDTLHVVGSLTIMNGEDVSGFTILADRSFGNSVTVEAGAVTNPTYFTDLTVSGTMGGGVRYTTCVLGAIEGFDGGAKNCLITDEITVVGNGANYFTDCDVYSVDADAYKRLNISDKLVNLIRCRGNYAIAGKTSTSTTAIDLVAGCIKVESTCVAGTVDVAGIAHVVDESGAGCTVKVEHAVSAEYVASGVWDESLSGHVTAGSAGKILQAGAADSALARKVSTNKAVISADDQSVTIYDDDGVSVLYEFDVSSDKRTRTPV